MKSTIMLEADQWDAVLSRITGTVNRGTERISSNALLNLVEVGSDPVTRQKVAKRVGALHLRPCKPLKRLTTRRKQHPPTSLGGRHSFIVASPSQGNARAEAARKRF